MVLYDKDMGRPIYYKGIRLNAFGLPDFINKRARAKKTNRQRKFYYLTFNSNFPKNSPKNLIVMYDIPHEQKKERDWFRRQLKNFDYMMIQKSVWVGPSPLPKNFIEYVKSVGLKKQLKTFKLAKPYREVKSHI